MNQRVLHRYGAVEFLAVIVGCVFFAVEIEGSGDIFDGGDRRDDRLHALRRILEGSSVDEGLKHRARLAGRQGGIELAFAIIASADESAYFSRAWIQGYQSDLHLRYGLTFFLPRGIALGEKLVDSQHSGLDGGARGSLKLGVQCGVDAIALGLKICFRKLIEKMVFHHVDEVRSGTAFDASANEVKFFFLGSVGVRLCDIAILDHLAEDAVARFDGAIHVAFSRRVAIGRADASGQECGFAQAYLAHVLAEVSLRAFSETSNGKAATITEINFVGV